MRRLVCSAGGVSAFSLSGQFVLVASLPILTRLYTPYEFGLFTIYLAFVNILGSAAALRFEPSLYVVESRTLAHVSVKLVLLATLATTVMILGIGGLLAGKLPQQVGGLVLLIPLGTACAGIAEALNCWSLRFDHLRDFAKGRLVLPTAMAALQLVFGVLHAGPHSMILAHILSQCILIGYLGRRVLSVRDLRAITAVPLSAVLAMARREYKFPLFDLPATAACYAIINLPAVMIGSLFGTTFAGYFGVAARLVTGPVTLTATPLSNVLVAEAGRAPGEKHLRRSGHGLLLVAVAAIAVPALGFGLLAPYIVVPLLGEEWRVTGQIMTALAVMAAAQAVSTPLQEVLILVRRQEVRLLIDAVRSALVFGPLVFGAYAGWDPLSVIYLMAAGGTVGFALRAVASLVFLNRMASESRTGVSTSSQPHEVRC